MNKILISILISFFFYGTLFAQNTHWSTLDYSYSKGPVSPEYQYNYKIIINENMTGILIYTNSSTTKDYSFNIGKKSMKKLKKSLKNCKVFSVKPEDMKSDKNLIGGQQRELKITMWQAPNLDSRPEVIDIPSQVNEEYSECLNNLYNRIENIVPDDIWDKAKSQ